MVVLAAAFPPGPSAVIAYVVVTTGDTVVEPLGSTTPRQGSTTHEVACDEDHVKIAVCPTSTLSGSALIVTVGTGWTRVMVTTAVATPPEPEAEMTYVVVSTGATEIVPLAATEPIPGSIATVSACVEVQERIVAWPESTLVDPAVNVTVG